MVRHQSNGTRRGKRPDLKLGIEGTADQQMDRAKDQTIDDKQLTMLALTVSVARPQFTVNADPVLTIEPITWNVIGLDSNDVFSGPNR